MTLPLAKFARFCVVGAANAFIYGISTSAYISLLGVGEKTASVLGFCSAIPFAFLAHRAVTFSSRGLVRAELMRFVVIQAASMATSVLAMIVAVDVLRLHYSAGVLAGIVLVPIMTFLMLNRWVFRDQAAKIGSEPAV